MNQIPKGLWGTIIAAIIAVFSLILIIWKFDPYNSSSVVFILLFLSFFVVVNGVFIPAVYFYKLRRGVADVTELFSISVRQGLIISIGLTILFILQTLHLLAWWNSLLIVAIAVILDMYFKE